MKNKALKNPKFFYLNKITNNKTPNISLKKPNILNFNSENNNSKTNNINYYKFIINSHYFAYIVKNDIS